MERDVLRHCSVSSRSPPAALWKFNFKVLPTHQQSFIAASLVPLCRALHKGTMLAATNHCWPTIQASKLSFPKAAAGEYPQSLHRSRSHCALDPCVYDFRKSSPKSNAPQTRMDARGVFTTLLTCLRL